MINFNFSVSVSISNIEAGLLYKYFKMHPVENQYINDRHFAFYFKDFEDKKKFEINVDKADLKSCITVLEEQNSEDPLEKLLKKKLLKKIYKWDLKIEDELDAISLLESDYYVYSTKQFYEINGNFCFANYLKFLNSTS